MTINTIREELVKPGVLENAKISIPLARRGIKLAPEDRLTEWFFFRLILARHLLGRDKPKDIEQAIEYMQEARLRVTQKSHPRMWADTCVMLAMGYDRRQTGPREENVKKAIKEYESSLKVFSKDAYPELWATINYSLGTTYSLREHGKRLDNIRKAIRYYRCALEVFTPDKDQERHNDIEAALRELSQEEKANSRPQKIDWSGLLNRTHLPRLHPKAIVGIVFISYRRDDSPDRVARIYQALTAQPENIPRH